MGLSLQERLALLRAGQNKTEEKKDETSSTLPESNNEEPPIQNMPPSEESTIQSTSSNMEVTEITKPSEAEEVKNEVEDLSKLSIKERLARLRSSSPSTNVQTISNPNNTSDVKSVTSLSNLGKILREKPELPPELSDQAPASAHSIRDKIYLLQIDSEGISLKDKMKELQIALHENPTAVSFMLPEDFGEMVRHIRLLTNNAVAQALSKPATSRSKGKAAIKADVSIDDLSF